MKALFALMVGSVISVSALAQATIIPVSAESKVHFVIKNMGINTGGDVSGLKGSIVFNPRNPSESKFMVSADVNTVDTDNERRDAHLKNEDFFDATKYPTMSIKSTSISKTNVPGKYNFAGTLTIKDVTKPINFDFTAMPNGTGYTFEGEFAINRLTYKVGEESATMSDDIKINLKVVAK